MSYKRRYFKNVQPEGPPIGPLTGGKLAKADQVGAMFAEQDRILGHGRRIVASGGLSCADDFMVASSDTSSVGQTHPLLGSVRVVHVATVNVTPGHYLACSVAAVYSGAMQKNDGGAWVENGKGGAFRCIVTYDNGLDNYTVPRDIQIPFSPRPWAAEVDAINGSFGDLFRYQVDLPIPNIDLSMADTAAWSDFITAQIIVGYVDAPRIVDWCVYEVPYVYARDAASGGQWATSLYVDGQGKPPASYTSKHPVSHRGIPDGDLSSGFTYALEVAARQTETIGPALISTSTWNEAAIGVNDAEPAPMTSTTTSYKDLWRGGVTSWDETRAGWSLSSGGNAAQWDTSGPNLELRDKARVVPVRVSVYAKATGGGTGRLQLRASDYSVAEIVVNSSSYQWFETDAHLLCGFGAEDESTVILFGRVSSGGTTLSVQYFQVQFIDA